MIKALPLYEGASVYFDHQDPDNPSPRRFIEKFGRFVNVRYAVGDGVRGDFRYNPRHLYAETFRGWLETDPAAVGFSHTAQGKVTKGKDGRDKVTEILAVESVDMVTSPATTRGMFESHNPQGTAMDPMITNPGENAGGDESYEMQLGKLVASIVQDESLSMDEKKKKVLAALKLMGEEEPKDEPKDEPKSEDDKTEEAKRLPKIKALIQELDTLKTEKRMVELTVKAKALCEKHQLPSPAVTDVFLASLVEAKDEAKMVSLIKDRKAVLSGGRGPISLPAAGGKEPTVDDLLNEIYKV